MSTEVNTEEIQEDEKNQLTGTENISEPVAIQAGAKTTTVVTPGQAAPATSDSGRGDVSASTIARMMGMATAAEFRVLEGKVDLLSAKVNAITGKLERLSSTLANAPTGSDLERIDVQISSLRTALNDAVVKISEALDQGLNSFKKAKGSVQSAVETKDG